MLRLTLACVAGDSVRSRSKERGTRVNWRAKNGASKLYLRHLESPFPIFHFLALVSLLARSKPKIPFLGLLFSETKRKQLLRRLD